MTRPHIRSSAAGRVTRPAANGCLILLMVPAAVLAYFWYEGWHVGHVNARHRQAAVASIHQQSSHAGAATARALNSSSSTDPDELAAAVWRHTHAPLIAYDASHRAFIATASRSALYDKKVFPLGGGPGRVVRCFTFTFVRGPGSNWATKVAEHGDELCNASRNMSDLVALGQRRIKSLPPENLTRSGLVQALDPNDQESAYAVRNVVRRGQAVTIIILARVGHDGPVRAEQCYRFTRRVGSDSNAPSVVAVPLATC